MKIFSLPRCGCDINYSGPRVLLREDAHVHSVSLPDQLIQGPAPESRQSAPLGMADKKLGNSPRSGKVQQSATGVIAFQNLDAGSGGPGKRQPRIQRGLILLGNIGL